MNLDLIQVGQRIGTSRDLEKMYGSSGLGEPFHLMSLYCPAHNHVVGNKWLKRHCPMSIDGVKTTSKVL
jgi:hypothetical protein